MRPSEVRAAIVSVIEGLTPSPQVSPADRYVYISAVAQDGMLVGERGFQVLPQRLPHAADGPGAMEYARRHRAAWDLSLFYASTEEALDRAMDDAHQIEGALVELKRRSGDSQIVRVDVLPGVMESDGPAIRASYEVSVEYDPRDP